MVFELCDYDITGLLDRPGVKLSQVCVRPCEGVPVLDCVVMGARAVAVHLDTLSDLQ